MFSEGIRIPHFEYTTGPTSWIGRVDTFVLGTEPACLTIMEHEEHGRRVLNCDYPPGSDEWCILSHGSFNGGECPAGDCTPVAVHDSSWGAIKALYK